MAARPHLSKFEKDPELRRMGDLFTADLITRYIQGKVGADNVATLPDLPTCSARATR
jgi:hypothetical protein